MEQHTYPYQAVLWFKLLCVINRIINQTEFNRFTSSKVSTELEDKDRIWIFHIIYAS